MQQIIIILIVLTSYTKLCFSQLNKDSLLFEYEKGYFLVNDDEQKNEFILKKIRVYTEDSLLDKRLNNEIDRVNFSIITDTVQLKRFFWNAALSNFLDKKYYPAANYYNYYSSLMINDSLSMPENLLDLLIHLNIDSTYVNSKLPNLTLKDSDIINLKCFECVAEYKKRHYNFYLALSAIVPGSGSLMLGGVKQGSVSLVLNTGIGFAVYFLIQNNLYINSVTWGFALIQKFYLGNIRLTDRLFERKEIATKNKLANKC